jgi:membrane-anchored mycosin MYCP
VPTATPPPPPKPPDSHARVTALRGAAICLVALTGTLAAARLRGSRNRVAGN